MIMRMFYKKRIKQFMSFVLVAGFVFNTGYIPVQAEEISETYEQGEILVLYKEKPLTADTGEEISVLSETNDETIALVELPEGMSVEDGIQEYMENEDVLAATPNYMLELEETENINDPGFVSQSYLSEVYAQEAWEYYSGMVHEKVRVAVLDTGADITHPDLENIINLQISGEIVSKDGTIAPLQGDDYMNGQFSSEGTGHGTHVCGILAAEANNLQGVAGVGSCLDNSAIELMVVDIFSNVKTTTLSYLIRGMEYAAEQGAKVINLSLGVEKSQIDDAILNAECDKLKEKNITLICAAGNEGICDEGEIQEVPCDYDSTIGVASVDASKKRASFSNYGTRKDIVAPGVNIYSTLKNGSYGNKSGTSMSTPIVSAVAAMMYAIRPDITPEEVKSILKSTAGSIAAEDMPGIGIVNCKEALEEAGGKRWIPFTDVAVSSWCYDHVAYVYDKGIMTGLNETTFGPGEELARAQFAMLLYRLDGELETEYEDRFPDVSEEEWYGKAVTWASRSEIISGYSDSGLFGPNDPINREQLASMLYRYAIYRGWNVDVSDENKWDSFTDTESVNEFAKEAMTWAVYTGIIQGDGGRINPQGNANRAECATMVERFITLYDAEESETAENDPAAVAENETQESTVTLSEICIQDKGSKIEASVVYQSQDEPVRFRWSQYDVEQKKWTTISDWQNENQITWYPSHVGAYWLYVEAVSSDGTTASLVYGYHYQGSELKLNGICVLTKENQVDMGVAYETNDEEIQFRWLLYNVATKKWSQISAWNKGNWSSWIPDKAGTYWLYVEARTGDGKTASQSYGYRVEDAQIQSFTVSLESPCMVGCSVQLKGTFKEPSGFVQREEYLVYDGEAWSKLDKNEKGAVWTPETAGSYLLIYVIYGSNNKVLDQKVRSFKAEEPWVEIHSMSVRNDGKLERYLQADVQTNDPGIQYRWVYYDLTTKEWNVIQEWSSASGVSWTAPDLGNYWLVVEARLHTGEEQKYLKEYAIKRYQNPAGYYQIQDKISIGSADYNLMYGFEGLKVMYVMRKLGVGYGIGMGGAIYNDRVVIAVKGFQTRAGLPVTGVVDYNTWVAMGLPWQDWFNLGAYVSPMLVDKYSTREEHIEAMITTAYQYLGTPYVIGASGAPGTGIDCSGLVMQALFAAGLDVSPINPIRHSYPGYEYESRNMWSSPYFKHVSYAERQRGDLIFYQSSGGTVIHVAIYLGNDMVIESWPNEVVVWPIVNSQRSNIKGVVRPFI